ncbi:MAG: 4Fe-4S dicluster domain-containing protein [Defluviitaleaceae bacterium]|nr:4Fe-4S dicluster domain-containing protein [Defluviitaleaceae bacterium]
MAKLVIKEELCKGCSLCVVACPKKILELSPQINKKGYNPVTCKDLDACISCAFCATICPDIVIEVNK